MSNTARVAVPGASDGGKAPVYNAATDTWDLVDIGTQAEVTAHTGASAGAHAASAVSFSPAGTVAATTVQAAIAEVAADAAGTVLNVVRDYGAVPYTSGSTATNGAANQTAFQAALTAAETRYLATGRGAKIVVPAGLYYLTGTLHVYAPIVLEGEGGYHYVNLTSQLRWLNDVSGIVLHYLDTTGHGRADGSVIRDLALFGPAGSTPAAGTADGITIWAPFCAVENCTVMVFSRNGVAVQTVNNAPGSPTATTAPNIWALNRVSIASCGVSGVYVQGTDTNAGVGNLVSAVTCGSWGIDDASFLGNTWVGCHVRDCTAGAYRMSGAVSESVLLGCYSESGEPASDIGPKCLVLGGCHGAGFTNSEFGYISSGQALSLHGRVVTMSDSNGEYLRADRNGGSPLVTVTAATTSNPTVRLSNASGEIARFSTDAANGNAYLSHSALATLLRIYASTIEIDQGHATAGAFAVNMGAGTGNIQTWRKSGTERAKVTNSGEVELTTAGNGVVLKSPDGTRYRLAVENGGGLTVTAA